MGLLKLPNGATYEVGAPVSKEQAGDGRDTVPEMSPRQRVDKTAYHKRVAELATDREVRAYHLAKLRELGGQK
jgi:hypothetical protein